MDPALHRLSIRHLAVAADGAVWFGCQYMGPAGDRPALVGRHRRGQAPELFPGPGDALRQMRNYIGSVAVDAAGAVVATSSPVGGQIMYWDAASGRSLGATAVADGCGVAPASAGGFLVSSGLGAMLRADAGGQERPVLPASSDLSWDNHFRRVPDVAAPGILTKLDTGSPRPRQAPWSSDKVFGRIFAAALAGWRPLHFAGDTVEEALKSVNAWAPKLMDLGTNLLIALVILVVGWWVSALLGRWVRRMATRSSKIDPTIVPMFYSTVVWTVRIFTLIAVLARFGVQTASLIAVLGAARPWAWPCRARCRTSRRASCC